MALMKMPCAVGSGGGSPVLLWTNPNPTSAFAFNTTISISASSYNFFKIKFRLTDSNSSVTWGLVEKGATDEAAIGHINGFAAGRIVTGSDDSSITLGKSVYGDLSTNLVTDRNYCGIPQEIYGIK